MSTSDINEQKNALRVTAVVARKVARDADRNERAPEAMRAHFLAGVPLDPGAAIGGYWPIGEEMDVRPLLRSLYAKGHVCALPVARRRQALAYHRWTPEAQLTQGVFGIMMPDHATPIVVPDVILAPVLAFDARGGRIGYGGGYYDRTVPAIRARKKLLFIGIAYAAQEVSRVPTDEFDKRLNWIVTETQARRVERRRFPWLRKFLGS